MKIIDYNIEKSSLALSFLSGILFSLCFPPFNCLPLAFFSISYLFYLLNKHNSLIDFFLIAFLFGFSHLLITLSWVNNSLLIDNDFLWVMPISFFAIPGFIGLYYGAIGVIFYFLRSKNVFINAFLFAFAWAFVEYCRSFHVYGIPWNLIVYIWSEHNYFLQIVHFVNLFALDFFSVILFVSPFFVVHICCFTYKALICFLIFAELLAMYCFGFARVKNAQESFHENCLFRVVQHGISQKLLWKNPNARLRAFDKLVELTNQEGSDLVTHFIWGEVCLPYILKSNDGFHKVMHYKIPNHGILFAGTIRKDVDFDLIRYNSVAGIDLSDNKIIYFYDKNILVPFGEYIPAKKLLDLLFPRTVGGIVGISHGEKSPFVESVKFPKLLNIICFESIFFNLLSSKFSLSSRSPDWIMINTNDGWFSGTIGPHHHLAISKFIAVQNGVPVVRVANSGISAVIDPYGRELGRVDVNASGIIDFKMPKPILPKD